MVPLLVLIDVSSTLKISFAVMLWSIANFTNV